MIALVLAFPAYASLRFALAARAPNTLEQTAAWLEHDADARTARILVSPSVVLPLFWAEDGLRAHMAQALRDQAPWIFYQSLLPASDARTSFRIHTLPHEIATRRENVEPGEIVRYLSELSPGYVIVEQSKRARYWPALRRLRQAALAFGTPVFETEGQAPEIESLGAVDYQDVRSLATRILATRAFGPGITIYKMKQGSAR